MDNSPVVFTPKNFFLKRLAQPNSSKKKIGGEIIFFYHDSDHDYRETIIDGNLNFEQENKIQKKYSPLYLKRIPQGWKSKMHRRLHRFFDQDFIDIFASVQADMVADFCLEIYKKMGILDGIEVIRSSDRSFRSKTKDVSDFFVDVEYENEIIRARHQDTKLFLHKGGGQYINLPFEAFTKEQISAARDDRFDWMQSVLNCTHYIQGNGEKAYMDTSKFKI